MIKEKNIQKLADVFISTPSDKNFKNLYDRLRPGLLNHCLTILVDVDLAEHALVNCMSKVWLKIDQYNSERGNFSTWCYNIARNESLLLLKSRKRYTSQTEDEVEYLNSISLSGISVDPHEDPIWSFLNDCENLDDVYDIIIEEIRDLPPLYKDIMIDREINHMKYKDIAEKYNIKKRSIATRIRRARNKIRKKMEIYIKN